MYEVGWRNLTGFFFYDCSEREMSAIMIEVFVK